MRKEVGAGGRFDVFLDSAFNAGFDEILGNIQAEAGEFFML